MIASPRSRVPHDPLVNGVGAESTVCSRTSWWPSESGWSKSPTPKRSKTWSTRLVRHGRSPGVYYARLAPEPSREGTHGVVPAHRCGGL